VDPTVGIQVYMPAAQAFFLVTSRSGKKILVSRTIPGSTIRPNSDELIIWLSWAASYHLIVIAPRVAISEAILATVAFDHKVEFLVQFLWGR
jgi:hypothetical protein